MAGGSSSSQTGLRALFVRLIRLGKEQAEMIMMAMAFWMWLETQGFQEIITEISLHDDDFLNLLSEEAQAILSFLKQRSAAAASNPISPSFLRFTPKLAQRFLSLNAVLADKEKVLEDIKEIYNGVCCVVFKDILKGIEKDVSKWSFLSSSEEVIRRLSSKKDGVVGEVGGQPSTSAPYGGSKLNPWAKEWHPVTEKASEESRALYLTFSNGFHLTEGQIFRFFTLKYGPCVERVYVHWQKFERWPPLFGKIVFTASYVPAMILNGQNEAKFWVDSRPLWCKRFDPKKKTGRRY